MGAEYLVNCCAELKDTNSPVARGFSVARRNTCGEGIYPRWAAKQP